jgi:hypothetical protein
VAEEALLAATTRKGSEPPSAARHATRGATPRVATLVMTLVMTLVISAETLTSVTIAATGVMSDGRHHAWTAAGLVVRDPLNEARLDL